MQDLRVVHASRIGVLKNVLSHGLTRMKKGRGFIHLCKSVFICGSLPFLSEFLDAL
jgi:hypothetical protein